MLSIVRTAQATPSLTEATDKPTRFSGDDTKNGKVINYGVFATVNGGKINNYSLIEHADKDAKTYITSKPDWW